MNKRLFTLFIISLLLIMTAYAQEIAPKPDDEINPAVNISWPPPVYVLRGEVEIRGSANVVRMSNYFIEFRPVEFPDKSKEADTTPTPEVWFPVTLPETEAVDNDVLGTWNTKTAPDGLYELRLTINIPDQPAQRFLVSPIRIENNPPDFVPTLAPSSTLISTRVQRPTLAPSPTLIPTRVQRPTLAPSPTALDTTPRVTANLNSNVRSGDNTGYSIVGNLLQGETARVIGISASGSGWYFIELPNGRRGWIAPSIVTPAGDIRSVPRVQPPATATPTATHTPLPTGNLTGSPPSLSPNPPTCGQPFEVLVNITNSGTAPTTTNATITIEDIARGNLVQATQIHTVPPLQPGANFVVGGQFTISTFFNEEHHIVVRIDTSNAVAETIESDNVLMTTYILQKGVCA